jgi:membrane fusion protein (multidrug efflux system)
MNGSRFSLLVLVIVLLAVVGGGAFWLHHNASQADYGEPEAAADAAAPVLVEVASVERATLRPTLDLVGTIVAVPEQTAMISPQLGGWVVKLDVREGDRVAAGQPLVHLDARTAHTDVLRARALVAEKEAALKRLKRGYLPQELEVARQDRDKAKATVAGLQAEVAALDVLRRRGELSQVQYDTKVKTLESAAAALASAEAHYKLLQEGTPSELIEEAQSLLDAARADLEHAELTLEWCTMTSPIDGVVVQLLAHQGQFFDRAVPLATVMDLSSVFVQLRIPSREFGKVHLGTQVDVQLMAIPGQEFHGSMARISGEADPLTGNVNMFARIENTEGKLRPGLACQARVWLPEIPEALSVPVAAIADHSGTPVVTLIRDGKAHETVVELGAETHDRVQVLQGLQAGDLVATAGGYGLPEDCPVRVVKDLSAAKLAGK